MNKRNNGQWRQLLAIGLLACTLLALDGFAPVSDGLHMAMTVAIAIVCSALVLVWVETNADLVEHNGVDQLARYDQARRMYANGTVIRTAYRSHSISSDSASSLMEPPVTPQSGIRSGGSRRLPRMVYWMAEPMRAHKNRTIE